MKKGYWVVAYRAIHDEAALKEYGKLALPALEASGGKILIRTAEAHAHEAGLNQRVVVTEFESLEKALAAHETPAYQEALRVLGSAVERDLRIVEGV